MGEQAGGGFRRRSISKCCGRLKQHRDACTPPRFVPFSLSSYTVTIQKTREVTFASRNRVHPRPSLPRQFATSLHRKGGSKSAMAWSSLLLPSASLTIRLLLTRHLVQSHFEWCLMKCSNPNSSSAGSSSITTAMLASRAALAKRAAAAASPATSGTTGHTWTVFRLSTTPCRRSMLSASYKGLSQLFRVGGLVGEEGEVTREGVDWRSGGGAWAGPVGEQPAACRRHLRGVGRATQHTSPSEHDHYHKSTIAFATMSTTNLKLARKVSCLPRVVVCCRLDAQTGS